MQTHYQTVLTLHPVKTRIFSKNEKFLYCSVYIRLNGSITGVILDPLPVLSTEPGLRKLAVDPEIRFSTELYGCRQWSNMILTPLGRRKRKF